MGTSNFSWFYLLLLCITLCHHAVTSNAVVCDEPPMILNAFPDLEYILQPYENGTTVLYICDHGYLLTPNISSSATCIVDNGTSNWTVAAFSCNSICLDYPDIPNTELHTEDNNLPILSGSFISYSCELGYTLVETLPRILCVNGSWILPKEACRPKSCGNPGHIEHSHQIGRVYTFSSNVTYHCNEGYRLKGTATLYCMPSGKWRPSQMPRCEEVVCPLLPSPVNGRVISSERMYNAVARYECNRYFHIEGNAVRFCQNDATWNGSIPSCVATTCLSPGPLENGRILLEKEVYKPGDFVIFQCNHSHSHEEQLSSKCLEDGSWNKRPPLCLALTTHVIEDKTTTASVGKTTENPLIGKSNSCEDPGDIRNGMRNSTGFTPNSNVTYSCNDGYELRGEGTLTCLPSGKWSLNKLPICVKPIPISTILGTVVGVLLLIILGFLGFFFYRWRERKIRGYGKKSKALTGDATDLEEIAGLDKGNKPIPVTVL